MPHQMSIKLSLVSTLEQCFSEDIILIFLTPVAFSNHLPFLIIFFSSCEAPLFPFCRGLWINRVNQQNTHKPHIFSMHIDFFLKIYTYFCLFSCVNTLQTQILLRNNLRYRIGTGCWWVQLQKYWFLQLLGLIPYISCLSPLSLPTKRIK